MLNFYTFYLRVTNCRCYECAAMICKEMGDSEGALKYMNLAADGYAESGSSDTSAMALDKAAKCLEDIDSEKAIKVAQIPSFWRSQMQL